MKYKETGFRAFYKKFTVFMFTDTLREVTKNFPGAEQGNCILTYGYIDRSAGLTLEILAVGVAEKDNVAFFDGTDTYRSFLRIGAVMEQEFLLLGMKTALFMRNTQPKSNSCITTMQARK